MKTLSGRHGELSQEMEYWKCPKHGKVLRLQFEIRKIDGAYFAFHKGSCGLMLKPSMKYGPEFDRKGKD